jgi:hypothetical protein
VKTKSSQLTCTDDYVNRRGHYSSLVAASARSNVQVPTLVSPAFQMTQQPLEVDKLLDTELGDIGRWVERQEALERTGYMLRPRYHPGWKPSWTGTGKLCFDLKMA